MMGEKSRLKASIIILTYNQREKVGRAIESVLRQKCRHPYEILVADDDSPDGTRAVAERYAREYPDIVRMMPVMPNRGLVGNYFDALEATRGDYVGDCAGDDEWLDETRLEKQIDILDADPTLSTVFTDVEECRIDESGKRHARLHSGIPGRRRYMIPRLKGMDVVVDTLNNTKELPYTLSASLYRKSSLMEVYEKDRSIVRSPASGVEDLSVIATLGTRGDAAFLPLVGYRYYIDGESVSNNLSPEKEYGFYRRATLECLRLADIFGIDRRLLRDHINNKLNHISAQARHIGDPSLIAEVDEVRRRWGVRHFPPRAAAHLALLWLSGLFGRNRKKQNPIP